MDKNEYVESFVLNGKLINIGKDDAGQCYFVEWVDDSGKLKQEGCGTYNFHYKEYAEYKFGSPEVDCIHYDAQSTLHYNEDCKYKHKFGYCNKCFYQDVMWSHFQKLIDLGIIDRRGNVTDNFAPYLVKKEESIADDKHN